MRTRTEEPSGRKAKALATRRRVLSAAYELFCADGYAATTMPAIAEKADVAVQTLYFTFHTKGAILVETVGACVIGFDRWTPALDPAVGSSSVEEHAWFPAFQATADAHAALAVFVDAMVAILRRIAPLSAAIDAAVAADPEVKAIAEVAERRRVVGYAAVVARLARRGGLRRGVSTRRATDILLVLASSPTYQQLAGARGWSPRTCRAWLLDVLAQQLLPPASASPRRRR